MVSAVMPTTLRPVSRLNSRAVRSRSSALRAQMTTSQPDSANSLAIALPIPRLPPVTMAVLPSSSRSISRTLPTRSFQSGSIVTQERP